MFKTFIAVPVEGITFADCVHKDGTVTSNPSLQQCIRSLSSHFQKSKKARLFQEQKKWKTPLRVQIKLLSSSIEDKNPKPDTICRSLGIASRSSSQKIKVQQLKTMKNRVLKSILKDGGLSGPFLYDRRLTDEEIANGVIGSAVPGGGKIVDLAGKNGFGYYGKGSYLSTLNKSTSRNCYPFSSIQYHAEQTMIGRFNMYLLAMSHHENFIGNCWYLKKWIRRFLIKSNDDSVRFMKLKRFWIIQLGYVVVIGNGTPFTNRKTLIFSMYELYLCLFYPDLYPPIDPDVNPDFTSTQHAQVWVSVTAKAAGCRQEVKELVQTTAVYMNSGRYNLGDTPTSTTQRIPNLSDRVPNHSGFSPDKSTTKSLLIKRKQGCSNEYTGSSSNLLTDEAREEVLKELRIELEQRIADGSESREDDDNDEANEEEQDDNEANWVDVEIDSDELEDLLDDDGLPSLSEYIEDGDDDDDDDDDDDGLPSLREYIEDGDDDDDDDGLPSLSVYIGKGKNVDITDDPNAKKQK